MNRDAHDPRDIPILTEAVAGESAAALDIKALQSAVTTETLQLADSLLHQAAKDIEATLFEHVYDRLRAELPELIDRILREHVSAAPAQTSDD
jgi:Zn-dependent M32 family carboxypeptidase